MAWIKDQLEIRGLSQKDLALAVGMTPQMFTNVVQGRRVLKAREVDAIRRFFGFELPEERPSTIAVSGKVGAGDEVQLADDYEKGAGMYHVARPPWIPSHGVAAAEIDGASAEPFALSGDIIFWCRTAEMVDVADIGRPVIAALEDGRVMLKRLAHGTAPGHWSLLSINPFFPSHINVRLLWAARVFPPLPKDQVKML